MRMWTKLATVAGIVSAVAVVGVRSCQSLPEPVAEQITSKEFEKLLVAVRPAAGEDDFDKIAWQTSIWDARKLAAKAGKPILLWEMDGHPLGCG